MTTEKDCIAIQFRTTCVTGRTAVSRHGAERWARRLGAQQAQAWALGRAWVCGRGAQRARGAQADAQAGVGAAGRSRRGRAGRWAWARPGRGLSDGREA